MSEMNGFEYSIYEIDEEIKKHIPYISHHECTPRVMAEIDDLLDQRNELVYLMGLIVVEQECGI